MTLTELTGYLDIWHCWQFVGDNGVVGVGVCVLMNFNSMQYVTPRYSVISYRALEYRTHKVTLLQDFVGNYGWFTEEEEFLLSEA